MYAVIYWIWEGAFTERDKFYPEREENDNSLITFETIEDAKKYIAKTEKEYQDFWEGTKKLKCRIISIKPVKE